MEIKINIAAILKDKPQGTKLYDWLHNIDVELDTISTTDTETVVWCTNETNNNTTCHRGYSEFGTERGYPDGLQILFPLKRVGEVILPLSLLNPNLLIAYPISHSRHYGNFGK